MKNQSTQQNIRNYSLLTASVLLGQAAEGQIIYTDVSPDEVLGNIIPSSFPYDDVMPLDLNNDGTFDFNVELHIQGYNPFITSTFFPFNINFDFSEAIYGQVGSNKIFVFGTNTCTWLGAGLVREYNFGSMVDGQANDATTAFFGAIDDFYGCFIYNTDKYFGLMMVDSPSTHFGWVRIEVKNDPFSNPDTLALIVKDYAFNSEPNEPIKAGDTGTVFTSLSVYQDNAAMKVYPNPAFSYLHIQLPNHELPFDLQLTDITGSELLIRKRSVTGTTSELDVKGLAAGIYLLIARNEEHVFRKEIMIGAD